MEGCHRGVYIRFSVKIRNTRSPQAALNTPTKRTFFHGVGPIWGLQVGLGHLGNR